ncbi:MAG: adenylate kinase [Dongiaceae bacterium]
MRLVFMGAPGSGKGTQARRLMEAYASPQISTGDLLRAAVAAGTALGKKAKAAMDAGQLVADDIVVGMIRERLAQKDTKFGFILDGFPRSLSQAAALDKMLADVNQPLNKAILLDVKMDNLVKRLTGRRTCKVCGHLYNIHFSPPRKSGVCDVDGGELVQRADDNEDTIKKRLTVYESQTAPVIDYYKKQGKLAVIDGEGSADEIFHRIEKVLP